MVPWLPLHAYPRDSRTILGQWGQSGAKGHQLAWVSLWDTTWQMHCFDTFFYKKTIILPEPQVS